MGAELSIPQTHSPDILPNRPPSPPTTYRPSPYTCYSPTCGPASTRRCYSPSCTAGLQELEDHAGRLHYVNDTAVWYFLENGYEMEMSRNPLPSIGVQGSEKIKEAKIPSLRKVARDSLRRLRRSGMRVPEIRVTPPPEDGDGTIGGAAGDGGGVMLRQDRRPWDRSLLLPVPPNAVALPGVRSRQPRQWRKPRCPQDEDEEVGDPEALHEFRYLVAWGLI